MYLTYSHYYTYIKIPASAEKICGRRVFCCKYIFCRKLFVVEFIFLHYTKSKEFFCFGRDRGMETRKFKDLTIRDAFMFAAVMSDPEICRRVLELALGIPISEVHIQTEKTMAYHSLLAGDSYENLPDTYVIFICDFDPFGDGLYRYSTGMVCEETGKSVSDGVRTVYLNAHGRNRDGIPEELLQFLNYVKNTGRTEEISTTDPFVRHLQDSIDKIKQNRGMEERYMLLEEMMRNERQEGKIEGKLEGNTEGKQEFLLTALESKFSVPSELKEKIMSETDIEKLNLWFQISFKVSSLEEFEQNM